MNKQERQEANEYKLIGLIRKTENINSIVRQAEPFVKEYWGIIKNEWTKKITGRCITDREGKNPKFIPDYMDRLKSLKCAELKELNKEYNNLLK